MTMLLLDGVEEDTTGAAVTIKTRPDCQNNTVSADGDFGGGTVTIERYDVDLAAWIETDIVLTSTVLSRVVSLPPGDIRAVLADSTSPSLSVSFNYG